MKSKPKHKKVCTIFILSVFLLTQACQPGFSLPDPNQVVSGTATFSNPDATTLTITASDNSIINYNSFNIAANESVIINLPNVNSDILNRVLGGNASQILGRLTSNGIVVLINQNGIFFGPGANIDVGSLIASTRDITDQNFLNSKYLFEKLSKDQLDTLLLNQGTINIKEGGFGILIAGAVKNEGTIIAPMGTIALAAGDMVRLDMSGDGLISVAIDKETASTIFDQDGNPITYQIENTGTLKADGGTVLLKAESAPDIFKAAVNLDGYVQANNVTEKDGLIKIVSSDDVEVKGAMLKAGKIEIGEPGSGKMFLTGSNPQYFYGDGTFYNFTSDEFGKEIYFGAGDTHTFKGTTHIKGAPGYDGLTKLFSTEEGRQWYGDFSQADNFDVSYVALRDAYNLGDTITLYIGDNWGNSSNWKVYHTLNGSGDISNAGIWVEQTVPPSTVSLNLTGAGRPVWWNTTASGTFVSILMDATYDSTLTIQRNGSLTNDFEMRNGTVALGGNTLTTGTDLIITGGTFNAQTGALNIGRNFTNNGTFTPGTSTVTFTGNSTITGSTTFFNLTAAIAGQTLTFNEGLTQTITGALTLTGSAENPIKLRSSREGLQWKINSSGTRSVSNVDVRDSNAITRITPTGIRINNRNNTNWDGLTPDVFVTNEDIITATRQVPPLAAFEFETQGEEMDVTSLVLTFTEDEDGDGEEDEVVNTTSDDGSDVYTVGMTTVTADVFNFDDAMDDTGSYTATFTMEAYGDIRSKNCFNKIEIPVATAVTNTGDVGDIYVVDIVEIEETSIIWNDEAAATVGPGESTVKEHTTPSAPATGTGTTNVKVGAWTLTAGATEDTTLTSIDLSGVAAGTDLSKVKLYDGSTEIAGEVTETGAGKYNFTPTQPLVVPAGTTKTVTVRADVTATAGTTPAATTTGAADDNSWSFLPDYQPGADSGTTVVGGVRPEGRGTDGRPVTGSSRPAESPSRPEGYGDDGRPVTGSSRPAESPSRPEGYGDGGRPVTGSSRPAETPSGDTPATGQPLGHFDTLNYSDENGEQGIVPTYVVGGAQTPAAPSTDGTGAVINDVLDGAAAEDTQPQADVQRLIDDQQTPAATASSTAPTGIITTGVAVATVSLTASGEGAAATSAGTQPGMTSTTPSTATDSSPFTFDIIGIATRDYAFTAGDTEDLTVTNITVSRTALGVPADANIRAVIVRDSSGNEIGTGTRTADGNFNVTFDDGSITVPRGTTKTVTVRANVTAPSTAPTEVTTDANIATYDFTSSGEGTAVISAGTQPGMTSTTPSSASFDASAWTKRNFVTAPGAETSAEEPSEEPSAYEQITTQGPTMERVFSKTPGPSDYVPFISQTTPAEEPGKVIASFFLTDAEKDKNVPQIRITAEALGVPPGKDVDVEVYAGGPKETIGTAKWISDEKGGGFYEIPIKDGGIRIGEGNQRLIELRVPAPPEGQDKAAPTDAAPTTQAAPSFLPDYQPSTDEATR